MCRLMHGSSIKNELLFNNEAGVTLIELMVYMVLTGMLLSAAVMVFSGQNKTYNRQDVIAETQQNIRGATRLMVSEIRLAGFDPDSKGASGFLSATASGLSFDFAEDTNDDGTYETVTTIAYDLYDAYSDGGTDIGRTVGAQKRALAENIDRLQFEYLYWNYDTDVWVWANDAAAIETALTIPTTKALGLISAVKIIVLGSSRDSAFTNTDSIVFKPSLEGSGAGTTWTPAAGSGYNRLGSVVVQCRNNRG